MSDFDHDLNLKDGSRENLIALGRQMDRSSRTAIELAGRVLRIRDRRPQFVSLVANPAQEQFAAKSWGRQKNIVLKARQMGITTWVAGQFFLRTITHPGTVTVQVAHTQEAAESIFRIVHRFLSHLPDALRNGALRSAKPSARRLLVPELDSEYLVETAGDRNAGRGLTITNLHCTELARWPGDATDTLCGLMATLSPQGSLVMESTPMGAAGCFWNQWRDAEKTDTTRHFFPWWLEPAYVGEAVPEDSLTEEEKKLMAEHNELTPEKIAFRRHIHENFRGLARQEYAEDAESCFLFSGSCYFDVAAIDVRLSQLPRPSRSSPAPGSASGIPPRRAISTWSPSTPPAAASMATTRPSRSSICAPACSALKPPSIFAQPTPRARRADSPRATTALCWPSNATASEKRSSPIFPACTLTTGSSTPMTAAQDGRPPTPRATRCSLRSRLSWGRVRISTQASAFCASSAASCARATANTRPRRASTTTA